MDTTTTSTMKRFAAAAEEEERTSKRLKPEPEQDQETTFVRNVIELLKRELIIRKQLIEPRNFRCPGRRKNLLFELFEHGLEIKVMIKKLEEKLERSGSSD